VSAADYFPHNTATEKLQSLLSIIKYINDKMSSQVSNDLLPFPSNYKQDVFDLISYANQMHQHTKKQMEAASRSVRRRTSASQQGANTMASLTEQKSEDSSRGDVSSVSTEG
jgi:hypothetical protein